MRPIVMLLVASLLLAEPAGTWQSQFPVDHSRLGLQGSNPYFNLTPGYRLFYEHGKSAEVVAVMREAKLIDGVETRVVEDRETSDGQLVEVTRDYYAIDSATNDVYYFGEDVDVYKNGRVVSHEGSWLSGEKGAKFGLMMPAAPRAGQRFYQELAPGVGMDRAEVMSDSPRLITPAGTFEHTLHVRETSPLEKGATHKWYVSGIGPVKDGDMVLVKRDTL